MAWTRLLLGGIMVWAPAGALAQAPAGALVQAPAGALVQAPAGPGETIIVTGTRTVDRSAFDTLAPVDVLPAQAVTATVSLDLNDSLAQLVPSFNVQRLPLADGAIFVRPARLRGLSPDHTLVLVNGRRRHRSAHLGGNGAQPADLAWIPNSAIERIEVLRDGASAQYGSDALAGVINILLNRAPGITAFAQASQYYAGDGTQFQLGGRLGTSLGGRGHLAVTAEWLDQDPTSRTRQRPDAIAFQQANPQLSVPNPVQRWGKPEREQLRLAADVAFEPLADVELYAFGTWGRGSGVSDFNWRNPVDTSAYRRSPRDPAYNLFDIFPAGFTPRFGQDDSDRAITGGLRGRIGGLFPEGLGWDVSAGYGRNDIDYFIRETINASLGSASPTSFRAGVLSQEEVNLNLDLTTVFDVGLFRPLALAAGAERRRETFGIDAGQRESFAVGPLAADGLPSGSNGFPGYSDLQAGRFRQTSWAGYVDIEAPIVRWLTLGAALRHEDFSGFGDTTDHKLSARVEPVTNFAFRGTWSTGFRAPTPGQIESERTSQGLNTQTLQLVTSGRFSPIGPVADIINARPTGQLIFPLLPERSENLSLGLAWRLPERGLSFTADAYRVDVEDRFSTRGGFQLTPAERARLVALGIPGGESITNVSFFQNGFDTRTQGIDLVAAWNSRLGRAFGEEGRLALSAAYNYNETKVTRISIPGAFNQVSQTIFERFLPRHNATAAADYAAGPLGVRLAMRYYGKWTDTDDTDPRNVVFQDFSPVTFFDLAVRWQLTPMLSLRVGAENILDTYPDEARRQANRGLKYSRSSPHDTDGGKYYLRIGFEF